MKQTAPNPFARLQSLGLGARAGLLILVVVMTYALVAPLAWWLGAWLGLAAAAVAAGVCLVGALIARWDAPGRGGATGQSESSTRPPASEITPTSESTRQP